MSSTEMHLAFMHLFIVSESKSQKMQHRFIFFQSKWQELIMMHTFRIRGKRKGEGQKIALAWWV